MDYEEHEKGGSVDEEYRIDEFYCEICGSSYKTQSFLNCHLRYECRIESCYKCLVNNCTYKGKYPVGVRRHMARKHPDFDLKTAEKAFFS